MKLENILEKVLPKKKNNEPSKLHLQMQFINFLAYFNAYISCGSNVYQALKETTNNLQEEVQHYVLELVAAIDTDKSIKPYLDFARKFDNETITQIVTMIYQLSLNGLGLEQIEQMLPLLERLKNITISEYIKKEGDNLNVYLMTPLLGVTIVSIFFSIGVLTSIMVGI